jgi:multisubunit Na+/H+ antiporter MnhB subunit
MLLKLLTFAVAIIPIVLFVRALLGRRQTRLGAAMREFRRQVDVAIYVFLGLVGVIALFAFGKMGWAWWTSL